ncbi:MAG: CaiB/BaiF CoA-transferase family protein [Gemmobacter sp.]
MPAPGALRGLRVLDLSRVLAGPWAAQTLGDLGAEVIKVERPGMGDDTRGWGPPYLDDTTEGDDLFSAYYLCCNRNKRSVAVDFSRPEGAELIRRLALQCDVVIENFKVGALRRYGLDQESLLALNPRLVYCSITGFGQDGPYNRRGGYDFLIQGMGGLMSVTGPAPGQPGAGPTKVGVAVTDLFTGLYAVIAILAALRHRDETGQGQHIDCALLDTSVAILANQGMNWLVGGKVPQPMGNSHPNVVPYRNFPVADGELIIAVGNDRQFRGLCRILGDETLADRPEYATNPARLAHRKRGDVLAAMEAAGVPGGPINRIDEVFDDPQVRARAMVEQHTTNSGRPLPLTRFPARLSTTPASIRRPPPALGEHTGSVLTEVLGLSPEDSASLSADGVIPGPAAPEVRLRETGKGPG